MRERGELLQRFQRTLLDDGVPLAWLADVGVNDPAFACSQWMFMRAAAAFAADLRFQPDAPMSQAEWLDVGGAGDVPTSRREAALRLGAAGGERPTPTRRST